MTRQFISISQQSTKESSMKLIALLASAVLASSVFGLSTQTFGGVIVHDTFTDSDGTAVASHTPDVDLLGPYIKISNFPDTIQSNALQSGPNAGALLKLSTVNPNLFNVSASLEIDSLGGTSDDGSGRGLGIGFFPTATTASPSEVIAGNSFTGLILAPNGDLNLYNGGTPSTSVAFGGTFNPATAYTLSYTVNATTDTFSNIALSGSTADYSSLDLSGLLLNTAYVGLTSSGNGGGQVGIVDNFNVNTVPEPSSVVALWGLGAMGLFVVVRRRRSKIA